MSSVTKFENLKDLIVELRGQSVLLDADVAEIYGAETKCFTTMHTLIGKLKEESQSKGKAYLSSLLVIVDEMGYLPVTTQEAYLFFQFISYRYEKSPVIITSNKSFSDW